MGSAFNIFREAVIPLICLAFGKMELAPYIASGHTGCQGIHGPLPSAFRDKCCKKICGKDKSNAREWAKNFNRRATWFNKKLQYRGCAPARLRRRR